MSQKTLSLLISIIFTLSFTVSCTEDLIKDQKQSNTLEQFNNELGKKEVPYSKLYEDIKGSGEAINQPIVLETSGETTEKGVTCVVEKVKLNAGFDERLVLDATSDIFFPGGLVRGESIDDGTYIPILSTNNLAPVKFSTSMQNVEGKVSATHDGTLSDCREKINDLLLQKVQGEPAAKISYEIKEIYTKDQLSIALNVGFQYNGAVATANVASSFGFDKSETNSKILVKFIQEYYSIDTDLREKPSDYFIDYTKVDPSKFANMPLVVSSVKYGRMVLFSIVSDKSLEELKVALDATASYGTIGGSVAVDVSHQKVLNESTISAVIIGGSGSTASQTVGGYEGIMKFIQEGGKYSVENKGAPLGYTLRSIYDNAVMKTILSTEYNRRNCSSPGDKYRYSLRINHMTVYTEDGGDYAEIFGRASVQVPGKDGGLRHFFTRPTWNEYVEVRKNGGIIEINETFPFEADNSGELKFDIALIEDDPDYDDYFNGTSTFPLSTFPNIGSETRDFDVYEKGYENRINISFTLTKSYINP